MIKPEYIDLMNQELDGANTPDQSQRLQRYLADHAEARAYYEELGQSVGVFEQAGMLNPPPTLRDSILSQVDQKSGFLQRETTSTRRGFWAGLADLLRPRLEPAYAFTFLAGLAFGVALFTGSSWLTNRHGTAWYDQVRGTANHAVWNPENSTAGELVLTGITGNYRTRREGANLHLGLSLSAQQPAVITLSHGPQTTLQSFHSNSATPSDLRVATSQIELNHQGQGSYDLVFHVDSDHPLPLTMSVFSEGKLLETQTLVIGVP